MSLLIEVQLLDHTILLACDENSTVASVTANALAEYRGFNLKASPQKVLYTKDSAGRVLSGSLKIIQNQIDTKLHVVVADYNGKDSVNPAETLALYREWQVWSVNLLKENVQELSIREVPPHPDSSTLSLLFELCGSPSEAVQLLCVKVLQLLLTKFPQRSLVMEAAERICLLYATTESADVAIAALESFKGLSPLQAKVFSGSRSVRDMFDLQSALARFPPDQQGAIFAAFEQISGILGDQELDSVLTKRGDIAVPLSPEEDSQRGLKNVNFLENINDTKPSGDTGGPLSKAEPRLLESPLPTPPSTKDELPEPVPKRINLKRLESLLSSGDPKVRLYALEKLLKLLSLAAAGHRSYSHKGEVVSAVLAAPPAVESRAYELHEPPRIETVVGTAAGGGQEVAKPNSAYVFSFTDGKEVESLVKCLFRTLKECIHARPKRKPDQPRGDNNQPAPEDLSPVSAESKGEGSSAAKAGSIGGKEDANAQKGRAAVTAASTPGRLIQNALMSPQSDEPAVLLIIDCIWQIVHFPCDVDLGSQFPKGLLQTHRRKLKMNGRDLSNIQLVFASAAREWYRLLLTLSHADEGSKLLRYADLAEKCAFFFVLVVLHGMERGWKESELTLEAAAIESFASGSRPNFRSYLGLTYLASLSACCFPDSTASGDAVWSVDRSQQQADSKEGRLLQEILLSRSFAVSKTLWRWATPSAEHRARRCSLLALDCISSCCVFSSFTSFMYKLDPITRLASMLQLAVRDDKAERSEFSSGFEDSTLSSSASGKHRAISDDDGPVATDSDWDADKETFRMAVLADGEYADDEDEIGAVGPTLDSAFPGTERKGPGLSPRPGGAEPVIEAESALSRMMNRKGGVNDAAAAVARRALAAKYVYPDVPTIRLILKTIANLLSAANSREVYSEANRGEVGNWMQEVEVGPAGDLSGRVRLSRIATKDQVVMFYYSIITRS